MRYGDEDPSKVEIIDLLRISFTSDLHAIQPVERHMGEGIRLRPYGRCDASVLHCVDASVVRLHRDRLGRAERNNQRDSTEYA